MSKTLHLTCLLTLSAIALSAQAIPLSSTVQTTGMVGIADAQTAQLNLLNPGVLAPALGIICTASVSFVDSTGNVLKSATLTIPPGKSMSLSLKSDTDLNLVVGDRVQIRATITIPPFATPAATVTGPACKVLPTLEMIDNASGRTLVVLGHVETVPSIVAAATPQP
jgi:hypothetical protein